MKRLIIATVFALIAAGGPAGAQTTAASPAPAPAASAAAQPVNPEIDARMRKQWADSANGVVDRSQYNAKMNGLMTADGIKKLATALTALGTPTVFAPLQHAVISGSTVDTYRVTTPQGQVDMSLSRDAAGKIDGLWYRPSPSQ